MKIIFNLIKVGLSNNGGSKTLIRCAETLMQMGHEALIISNVPSKYTWHKPVCGFVISNKIPPCDVCIATGYHSVNSTVSSKSRKKFYYIRGYENWVVPEKQLINSYRQLPCLVNSEWLQRKLSKNNIASIILYPGLDFEYLTNENKPRDIAIGALWHKRKTKRCHDAEIIASKCQTKLMMLNRDLGNCGYSQLQDFYNRIKIWFAPTELEGLHNPPMEAAMCGCALVCSNAKSNGMLDYAIHEKTALIYPSQNLDIAYQHVTRFLVDDEYRKKLANNLQFLLKTKIGTRLQNMQKLVEMCQ